jgi:micrococcal nuclease
VADPSKRPRVLGSAIAVVVVGALAIAVYAGVSLADLLPSDSTSDTTQTTSADTPSDGSTTDGAAAEDSAISGIPAGAFAATVSYVHDGDTLFLDNGSTEIKVRLIGIDTPELDSQQNPDAGECYGEEARELLRDFLPEGTAVWALEDREPEDRYGRSLLYLYLGDGTFVNLAMIELGAAEALKVGDNDRYWPQLRDAEDEANAAQLGMWGRC